MAKQQSLIQAINHNLAEMKHLLEDTCNLVKVAEKKISADSVAFVKQLEAQASMLAGVGEVKTPRARPAARVQGKAPAKAPGEQGAQPRRVTRTRQSVSQEPGVTTEPSGAGEAPKPKRVRKSRKQAAGGGQSADPSPVAGGADGGADRQTLKCAQCGKLVYSDDPEKKCTCGGE